MSRRYSIDSEPRFKGRAGFAPVARPEVEFVELPRGFFAYMLLRASRVIFISAGMNPFGIAEGLLKKYRGDKILYKPISYLNHKAVIAELINQYQPIYNFKAPSIELAELNAFLGGKDATAA